MFLKLFSWFSNIFSCLLNAQPLQVYHRMRILFNMIIAILSFIFIIAIAIFTSEITINKKPSCTVSITNRDTNTCQNKSNFIETHGIFHLISTNMFASICSSKNICLKVITWILVLSRRDLLPPTFYFVHNWKELTRIGQN